MNKELIERMKAAIEGECEGLSIDDQHAKAILEYVLEGYIDRIDAERGKDAVYWRAIIDKEQIQQQLNRSLHVVGFRKLSDAESWVASKLDFDGWRYTIEPLFLSPTIPEGMVLVPIEPPKCARCEELETELERERMRLAACRTAALGYFNGCKDEYKSASLDDVLRMEAKLAAADKVAERFEALQNMPIEQAQAFFWNFSSRTERAKAIDSAIAEYKKGETA